jgi:AraC family transcriptional regulator
MLGEETSLKTAIAPPVDPFCSLWLNQPPHIVQCGHARHGRVPDEFYQLHSLWCLHHYDYHALLKVGPDRFQLHPGAITLMPPGVSMHYQFNGPSPHVFVHFTLESPFACPRGAQWLPAHHVPSGLKSLIDRLPTRWQTRPRRAESELWQALWLFDDRVHFGENEPKHHPALSKALVVIESKLSHDLSVGYLAQEAGLTQQQLNHHARRHLGCSLGHYMRRRRMERASHLLRHTDMPVKAVAAEVGMADLHQFNKFFKHYAGVAPRSFRAASTTH